MTLQPNILRAIVRAPVEIRDQQPFCFCLGVDGDGAEYYLQFDVLHRSGFSTADLDPDKPMEVLWRQYPNRDRPAITQVVSIGDVVNTGPASSPPVPTGVRMHAVVELAVFELPVGDGQTDQFEVCVFNSQEAFENLRNDPLRDWPSSFFVAYPAWSDPGRYLLHGFDGTVWKDFISPDGKSTHRPMA